MKVYLGGPINGCTDEEANGWREEVKKLILTRGYLSIDPMRNDYRGRELDPGVYIEIVNRDKADIEFADVLLMNCPKPSVGTSMEVFYGWTLHKRVVAVVPKDHKPSPWLLYHADVRYGSILDAAKELCS